MKVVGFRRENAVAKENKMRISTYLKGLSVEEGLNSWGIQDIMGGTHREHIPGVRRSKVLGDKEFPALQVMRCRLQFPSLIRDIGDAFSLW